MHRVLRFTHPKACYQKVSAPVNRGAVPAPAVLGLHGCEESTGRNYVALSSPFNQQLCEKGSIDKERIPSQNV